VSQAIQQLTLPAQMGEVVKVMGLTKNVDLPETFTQHDILYTL
jgi:SAM-dependent MidA family methyltransferase